MRVASLAGHLAGGETAARLSMVHVFFRDRLPVARPARSRIELVDRREECGAAADAAEDAFAVLVPVRAAERPFGAALSGDIEGKVAAQLGFPLIVALDDFGDRYDSFTDAGVIEVDDRHIAWSAAGAP